MSLCLYRTKTLSKCLTPVIQQVAHYNDKYVARKKRWPEHVNNMRKTKVLRKILNEVEPTPHDTMLEKALRFSEGEFRAQLLHLREEWGKMYNVREETARATSATQHKELEKERWTFVKQLNAKQAQKRRKNNNKIPMIHSEMERLSIEEDYRRSQLTSPNVEVDSFLQQQSDQSILTPDNFDSILDQVLSESKVDTAFRLNVKKKTTRLAPFVTHNIEFLLDNVPANR